MAPRASWKGFLTVGALSCAVGLYAAASTSERISLHMVSRKSGHRLRRQYVDEETGQPVETDDQVRGYEVSKGEYVTIAPEEAAAVLPDNDKTISIDAFLPCDGIDTVYLDRPYFLAPVDEAAAEVFDLLRRGMAAQKVAALGEALLFRRVRKLLIRPAGEGGALLASTLSFDYEVRSAQEAFADVPDVKITGEMRELATHIIKTKAGKFDPDAYQDRYETALAELVRAKMEGKPLPKAAPRKEEKVVDLLAALRASAKATGGSEKRAPAKGKSAKASTDKPAPARKSTRKAS
ncbi:non-homologous end joining protein Ku [Xanthobacter aminoxidans]|uniref:non-homologous end joining protein Ku n=1 Tax=Xanthobacter aminoxidans TaxID=186280 RepID=UPI00372B0C4F